MDVLCLTVSPLWSPRGIVLDWPDTHPDFGYRAQGGRWVGEGGGALRVLVIS